MRNLDHLPTIDTWGRYDIKQLPLRHKQWKGQNVEVAVLKAEDILHIDSPHYLISSVASSCEQYDECPIEAIERAKANRHKLHFIISLGVSITAHKQSRKQAVKVDWGQQVWFEGHLFTIEKAPNRNARLQEV